MTKNKKVLYNLNDYRSFFTLINAREDKKRENMKKNVIKISKKFNIQNKNNQSLKFPK